MVRYALLCLLTLVLIAGATAQTASQNNLAGHLVQLGAGKMFLNCTGNAPGPTVILEAGSGDSSEVWAAVQKQVEPFARVCSYDRLGVGKSAKLATAHTADEIVDDLHQLLHEARVPPPYVMVGHSIGGIYMRKYAAKYPEEVIGLVLRARRAVCTSVADFDGMGATHSRQILSGGSTRWGISTSERAAGVAFHRATGGD